MGKPMELVPRPERERIHRQTGNLLDAAAQVHRMKQALDKRTRYAEAVARLLREALPEKMGGTPDLFAPRPDGWDDWEEEARRALSEWEKATKTTGGFR